MTNKNSLDADLTHRLMVTLYVIISQCRLRQNRGARHQRHIVALLQEQHLRFFACQSLGWAWKLKIQIKIPSPLGWLVPAELKGFPVYLISDLCITLSVSHDILFKMKSMNKVPTYNILLQQLYMGTLTYSTSNNTILLWYIAMFRFSDDIWMWNLTLKLVAQACAHIEIHFLERSYFLFKPLLTTCEDRFNQCHGPTRHRLLPEPMMAPVHWRINTVNVLS